MPVGRAERVGGGLLPSCIGASFFSCLHHRGVSIGGSVMSDLPLF